MSESKTVRFCPRCASKISPLATICPHCGRNLAVNYWKLALAVALILFALYLLVNVIAWQ